MVDSVIFSNFSPCRIIAHKRSEKLLFPTNFWICKKIVRKSEPACETFKWAVHKKTDIQFKFNYSGIEVTKSAL